MRFEDLALVEPVLRAVAATGYTQCTPIQEKAIPPVRDGHDLIGIAQTGTGKTAGFALPVLHRLHTSKARKPGKPVRCLVLAPTRELALQVGDSFKTYGAFLGLTRTVIFGGVGQNPQVQTLRQGVDILVACPGRLLDLIGQGHCRLDAVEVLVLDEADRMLDMGFLPDIKRILGHLPKDRQTLLFSATMPPPIRELARGVMRNPVEVAVAPVSSTAETVTQGLYHVPKLQKQALLAFLLQDPKVERVLVFTRTKHGADKVVRKLEKHGIVGAAIHGNKSQNARQRALAGFKSGQVRVLVASDIAARGLDVDGITHVINFDVPNEPETYVHRIGRTGRAGATGTAWSLCDGEERAYVTDIERITKRKLPVIPLPDFPRDTAPEPDERPPRPPFGGRGGRSDQRPAHPGPLGPNPHRSGHGQPGRRDHGHGPRGDRGGR